jgi:cephalosporin hydroxylase
MPRGLPAHPPAVQGSAFAPSGWQRTFLRPSVAAWITRQFARLYYARVESTVFGTRFLGIQTLKYPSDLWIYQEIVADTQPDVIVETGTWHGGSALFLAVVCEAMGHGRVLTIDPEPGEPLPGHPRVTYLRGSSTDPQVLARVADEVRDADSAMVVEDTNINGHPVYVVDRTRERLRRSWAERTPDLLAVRSSCRPHHLP